MTVFLTGGVQAQIYADVKTSKGDFTIQLSTATSAFAPQTAANFIRLAEGTCSWVDPMTGQVKKEPYYDGVIFHRVINGGVSQTGSRKGDGSDSPGYNFRDDFTGGNHTNSYTVSMANSGPHTNGAQFFITASTQNQLNGVHSVFGVVILYDAPGDGTHDASVGRRVCDIINAVEVDSNNKPLEDITIHSIMIRRVGMWAKSFDEHAQSLPDVVAPLMEVHHDGAVVSLEVEQPAYSLTDYSYSADIANWATESKIYRDGDDDSLLSIDVSSLASEESKLFFNVSQVRYDESAVLWPRSMTGRRLSLTNPKLMSQWGNITTFIFTSETGGTVSNVGGSGNFTIVTLEDDWLGSREYIETNLKYTYSGKVYDVYFRLRLAKDQNFTTYFQGRHSGSLFLVKNGNLALSESTNGSMQLTR